MAGRLCLGCGQRTLFATTDGKYRCSKCGYELSVPVNGGRGGRGKRCPICKRYTFHNGKCSSCGATERKVAKKEL